MTAESPQSDSSVKSLILKGLVGAVSLAGATAIPIVIQRALDPAPTTNAAPAEATTQVSPAAVQTVSPIESPSVAPAHEPPGQRRKKEKERH